MLFTSSVFMFMFLPLVLLLYFLSPKPLKNHVLLAASIFFYAWGEPRFVVVFLLSILWNYLFALFIDRSRRLKTPLWNGSFSRFLLFICVAGNLFLLFFFKYFNFSLSILRRASLLFSAQLPPFLARQGIRIFNHDLVFSEILLPLGISFFSFQAMSYVIDVYRADAGVQKNPLNLAVYIALFPQLVAGPIVRYKDVAGQIDERTHSLDMLQLGARRFILGFAKKLILANQFALIADECFGQVSSLLRADMWTSADASALLAVPEAILSLRTVPVLSAWLGALAYSFQIYFDFSGYSDMAIGLGKIFGFHFLENFNQPYSARSISDFWRRWHISLSNWFRDYVYIPLGGSRLGRGRLVVNLLIVWTLTGIWHGANWTFIVWGFYYFILLSLEKFFRVEEFLEKAGPKASGQNDVRGGAAAFAVFYRLLCMVLVVMAWILFRSENLTHAAAYLRICFGLPPVGALRLNPASPPLLRAPQFFNDRSLFFLREYCFYWIAAILLVCPTGKKIAVGFRSWIIEKNLSVALARLADLAIILTFFVALSFMITGSYNPFIYFNF